MDSKRVLEQAASWVVKLNDAAATERDFLQWQAWLGEDASHARAFQELQETWRRSAGVPRSQTSGLCALEKMRAELDGALRESRSRFVVRWAAAAMIAIVMVGGGAALWLGGANTIETGSAELRSVRLPDGSRVALGPETRLQIAFSERRRLLKMPAGEAFFEVAHAPQRPFSVETPAGRVVAVGTAFSVNAGGERMAVTVTEGSVRVEPAGERSDADGNRGAAPILVAAGHRLVRDGGDTRAELVVSAADATGWREGRLEYEGEPLRVVVSDINRYSTRKLRIDDEGLREMRYTGTVFPDSLDLWLASIEGVFPLRVEERGDERLIVRDQR